MNCVDDVMFRQFCLLFNILTLCHVVFGFRETSTASDECIGNSPQRRWISELFMEARDIFRMDSYVSSRCRRDLQTYRQHLQNQTVWAVRMMESSEWPTTGLFAGMTKPLGNWDECIRAIGPLFRGQYCLAQMSFDYDETTEGTDSTAFQPDDRVNDMSVWHVIKRFEKDAVRMSRLKLKWALCIPSSCTPRELQNSLNGVLEPIFDKHNLRMRVKVEPKYCSTGEPRNPYSPSFYITCCLFGAVVGTVLMATIIDVLEPNICSYNKNSFWSNFSIFNSLEKLNQDGLPPNYRIFLFLKIAAIIMVIMGHTAVFELRLSVFQTEKVEEMFHPHHRLLNDSVDIFLVTSGFLLYNFHYEKAKLKGLRYVMFIVGSRWIKIALVYGVCMLFFVNIMPKLGDGPFWKAEISKEVGVCQSYWWLNLLGLANIPTNQPTCILTSWFVSVFIQLTILGGIVLAVLSKNVRIGVQFLIFLISSSIIFTFLVVYGQRYNVMILGFLRVIEDHRSMKDGHFYISTYPRVGPYLLGFAAAFLADRMRSRKYALSPIQKMFFLTATIDIALRFALYKAAFYTVGRSYNPTESALFAALQRSVAVLPIACFLCIHFSTGFDITLYRSVVEWRLWQPIGRLVPTVSFVHFFLLVFNTYSRRTYSPVHNLFDVFWYGIAYVIYSFVVAFVLYLFLVRPLMNLLRMIENKLGRCVAAA